MVVFQKEKRNIKVNVGILMSITSGVAFFFLNKKKRKTTAKGQ